MGVPGRKDGRVDGVKTSDFSFNGLAAETEYVIYSFMTDDEIGRASCRERV